MKPNKIIYAVCGTQNTGKSTFVQDLIDATKTRNDEKLRFIESKIDYRQKITDAGLNINRNGDIRSQQIIFDTLCENVYAALATSESNRIVLDRAPIDAFVYTVYLFRHNSSSGVTKEHMYVMWEKLLKVMCLIDTVVYIPLSECNNVKVVDDKFRDTDLEYRQEIDSIFGIVLKAIGNTLPCIRIVNISGSRDERVMAFVTEEYRDVKGNIKMPEDDIFGTTPKFTSSVFDDSSRGSWLNGWMK